MKTMRAIAGASVGGYKLAIILIPSAAQLTSTLTNTQKLPAREFRKNFDSVQVFPALLPALLKRTE